jgi:hypothetical protein
MGISRRQQQDEDEEPTPNPDEARQRIKRLLHPDDPDLEPELEVLEFRIFRGNRRVLLPSELDLANRRMSLAQYERALKRHEDEQEPREIAEVRKSLPELEGKDREEALNRIWGWEDQRISERRTTEALIANAKETVLQYEALIDGNREIGGKAKREVYVLRPFTHREMIRLDDKHGYFHPTSGMRQVKPERNVELLDLVLIGRVRPESDQKEMAALRPEDIIPKSADGLHPRVAEVLIDRILTAAQMPPELEPYFRDAGPDGRPAGVD